MSGEGVHARARNLLFRFDVDGVVVGAMRSEGIGLRLAEDVDVLPKGFRHHLSEGGVLVGSVGSWRRTKGCSCSAKCLDDTGGAKLE